MFLGALGAMLAAASAGAAVMAHGGRFSAGLDILTHWAPAYLAGAILGALLAACGVGPNRRAGLTLAAVGGLAAAALMAPEFLRDAGPTAPPGAPGEIKVIQFNVWRDNRHREQVVAWLKAENPDVLLVEEASPGLRNLIVARTGWRVAGAQSSDMIFTHAPYLAMQRPRLSGDSRLTWVNATYDIGGGPLEVMVTNTGWPTTLDLVPQGKVLRQVVSQLPRERMILGGDFNSTPWSFRRQHDDARLGLIRRDRALATWPTGRTGLWPWAAPIPIFPIDHVYAGPGWATTSVRRGPRLGSDHYPLIVTLAPVAPPAASPR
jgi:endonuclease/exonuclease/phosphatase (EEP) superfamily protein YafD